MGLGQLGLNKPLIRANNVDNAGCGRPCVKNARSLCVTDVTCAYWLLTVP